MKFFVKLLCAACVFWMISQFCHRQTDGFQITKITSDLLPSPLWDTEIPSEQRTTQLKAIFSQPFSFLGSGGQCYAFLSADQRVVLKVFKMHHLRQYPLLHSIRLPGIFDHWRVRFLLFQRDRLQRVFGSSKLAYSELKDETGLLYLNLNPSDKFQGLNVTLIDKIGIAHTVSLTDIPFAVQYRADNPFKMLRLHLKHHDLDSAKIVVREIFDFLKNRQEKGIKDLDPALRRNIGLLKERAISIDIGSFYKTTSPTTIEENKQVLCNDTRRMRLWLKKRSLELMAYLDTLLSEYGSCSGGCPHEREQSNNPTR